MLAQSRIVVDIVADTEKQQMADSAYYTDLLHELQGIQAYYGGEALSVWLTDIGGGEVLLSDGTTFSPGMWTLPPGNGIPWCSSSRLPL